MAREVSVTSPSRVVIDPVPAPRRVPLDAPWNWLAAGWHDLTQAPGVSLSCGAAFAVGAAVLCALLLRLEALSLFLPLAGGFLLLGPFLAVGLYATSRRLAEGQNARKGELIWAWLDARGQLGLFGGALLFLFLAWMQIAFLLLMLFFGSSGLPPPPAFMHDLLFTPRGLGLLIVGTIVGALLATLAFAISVFAIPMLLVRRIDAVSAARASLGAVYVNLQPMALWAALIVAIMAAGFATMLVGVIVSFPLIGHASWHAYTDVFGNPSDDG